MRVGRIRLAAFALLLAVAGGLTVYGARAGTFAVAQEAESAALSGNAALMNQAEASTSAALRFGGTPSIYWGVTSNSATYNQGLPPFYMQTVDTFEAHAGKKVSLVHWGMDWYNSRSWPAGNPQPGYPDGYYPFVPYIMDNVRNHGAIPVVSWFPKDGDVHGTTAPKFTLASIIEGKHDAFIRSWATDAKDWKYPFFLRFAHEMNGDWTSWSEGVNGNTPGQYVAAWRHVHDIFTEVGATNVTWLWCPNVSNGQQYAISPGLYPGDAYVDWTALDGYNWGSSGWTYRWETFDEIFRKSYDTITGTLAPNKPLLIAEVASHDAPGDKAAWITDMVARKLPQEYPKIKGFLWFNINEFNDGSGGRAQFQIESPAAAQAAFSQAIASPYYAQNRFGGLPERTKVAPLGD